MPFRVPSRVISHSVHNDARKWSPSVRPKTAEIKVWFEVGTDCTLNPLLLPNRSCQRPSCTCSSGCSALGRNFCRRCSPSSLMKTTYLTVQNAGSHYSAGTTPSIAPPPRYAYQTFASGNIFNGVNTFTNGSNIFTGRFVRDGGGLTNVSVKAANVFGNGSLPARVLPHKVALLDAHQPWEFRGNPSVFTTGKVGIGKINPPAPFLSRRHAKAWRRFFLLMQPENSQPLRAGPGCYVRAGSSTGSKEIQLSTKLTSPDSKRRYSGTFLGSIWTTAR